jgi:hypothetical protein
VSFVTQARSAQEAKACLNAVITEVSNNQDAFGEQLIRQKKEKIHLLSERLKIMELTNKIFYLMTKDNNIGIDKSFSEKTLLRYYRNNDLLVMNDLLLQINRLENELITPQTKAVSQISTIYSTEVPINKKPLLISGVCLASGLFLGMLVTFLMRCVSEIRSKKRKNDRFADTA